MEGSQVRWENSQQMVGDLFLHIATSHSRNYQCLPVPSNFINIAQEKVNGLYGGFENNNFLISE